VYRLIVRFFRFVVHRFFRRVEVIGLEHLPRDGGGILVSWHPNGMVDPGLILTHFPMRVVFGARHGLFAVPLLGQVMKAMGTVPIYRAMDLKDMSQDERNEANARALDALADRVVAGDFSCLFPEGDSHDQSTVTPLKTGAARFYYRARQLARDGRPPVIIPVGLHYDAKRAFRSNALVTFHPPLEIPDHLDLTPVEDEEPARARERCKDLTDEIDRVLREVVHATESWELHHLMHRARKLVRAERALRAGSRLGPTDMSERLAGFARVWAGYHQRIEGDTQAVHELVERVREYDEDLQALGLEDHELDRDPRLISPWLAGILLLQVVLVFLLLPPVLLVGYLINGPPALFLLWASKRFAKREKDEASIKVLGGMLLFPLVWAGVGVGAATFHGWLTSIFGNMPDNPVMAGTFAVVLSVLGGAIGLRYLRVARETVRALKVRLTRNRRRASIRRLRMERAELHDALIALSEGLPLPGEVTPEGRTRL
jgi:1-acyl-sn-glycerol-3-phosphate acyltransferase